MKAFKLASAFAVTGLALAVSGQAMADTTTEWTWDGEVVFSDDLMNNSDDMGDTIGSRGANGDSSDLVNVNIDVANGGFSATLSIESDVAAAGSISLDGVMYEEGPISFGQLSSMNSTEGYVSGMKSDLNYGVDQAFRYTMGNGLAIQAQGGATYTDEDGDVMTGASDMGVAVAYAGEFEGGSFAADFEYAETMIGAGAATDEALDMYYGVGVTMAASDAVEVKAAYTMGAGEVSSMGVRADYTADAFTAYASYVDEDITLGGTASVGAIDLYADYLVEGTVIDLGASTAGASGAMSYSASVDMADVTNDMSLDWAVGAGYDAGIAALAFGYASTDNAASAEITASATHTTEGGATVALEYTNDNDVTDVVDTLVFTAAYSF